MFDAAGAATFAATIDASDPDSDAATQLPIDPAVAAGASVSGAAVREIVFVAGEVENADLLTPRAGLDIVRLDPARDAIAQISAVLAGYSNLDAVHLVGHGVPGELMLGQTSVDAALLDRSAEAIAGWARALSADADLLIWGCDVGAGPGGVALIDRLAALTGADVAASDDKTGHASLGGDWDLEVTHGAIEHASPFTLEATQSWTHVLAPAQDVTGSAPASPDIGSTVTLNLTFDNTAASAAGNVGYGPTIDLYLRARGADGDGTATRDGLLFQSASTIGGADPVVNNLRAVLSGGDNSSTINLGGAAGAYTYTHPFLKDNTGAALVVTLPSWFEAGDQIVTMRLPFGSFGPDHPTIDTAVTLKVSDFADPNVGLQWAARAGFEFGADALDNPTADAPLLESLGAAASGTITPTAFKVTATNNAPEGETATGSNYVRTLSVTVDPADGTTLQQSGAQYLVIPIDDGVIINSEPTVTGGTIQFQRANDNVWESWNASNAANLATSYKAIRIQYASAIPDAGRTVNIDYWVNEYRRDGATNVVNATTGAATSLWSAANEISFDGAWTGKTGGGILSDASVNVSATADAPTLSAESVTIRKSSAIATDTGPSGFTPGDTVEYTLRVDLSDFFRGKTIVVEDTLGDGQTFAIGFTPTLVFDWRDNSGIDQTRAAASIATTQIEYDSDAGAGVTWTAWDGTSALTKQTADGTTKVRFLLTQELGAGTDVIIRGGRDGGAATDAAPGSGPTTGSIKLRATVDDTWTSTASYNTSGNPQLKENDTVSNSTNVSMDVVHRSGGSVNTTTGSSVVDPSSASNKVGDGALTLVIDRIVRNGSPLGSPNDAATPLMPDDEVTFKLTYDLVTGDFHQLNLQSWLPLPVFDVTALGAGPQDGNGGTAGLQATNTPTLNNWSFGTGTNAGGASGGTMPDGTGGTPDWTAVTRTADANSNGLAWNLANYSSTANAGGKVEIYFTLKVRNEPFADRLQLTTLGRQTDNNSQTTSSLNASVKQNVLGQANVQVYKGYVGSLNGATGSTLGTTVTNPLAGQVDATVDAYNSFTPVSSVTSSNVATGLGASNAAGFDASDWIRTAIAVENQGSATNGAFDVTIRDTLAAGFDATSVRNLKLTTGAGTLVNNAELYTAVYDLNDIGTGDTVTQIQAGATNLLSAGVNFATDAATTAQAVVDNINANSSVSGYRASVVGSTLIVGKIDGGTFGTLASTDTGFTSVLTQANWRSVALTATADGNSNGVADVTELAQAALFATGTNGGLRLVDGAGTGALGRGKSDTGTTVTDGSNVIVVTYDARIASNLAIVTADQTTNAQVTRFANAEGSTNFLAAPRQEAATLAFQKNEVSVALTSTSGNAGTSGANAAIGEYVTYTATIDFAEGSHASANFIANLAANLGIVDVVSVTKGSALSWTAPDVATGTGLTFSTGADPDLTVDFGTVTAAESATAADKQITIVFRATPLNVAANTTGTTLATTVDVRSSTTSTDDAARSEADETATITVRQPTVGATLTRSPTGNVDAGDTITYTLTLTNSGAADAYDVRALENSLPAGFGSSIANVQVDGAAIGGENTDNSTTSTLDVGIGRIAAGASKTVTFTVTVQNSVAFGDTLTVDPAVTWTSIASNESTPNYAGTQSADRIANTPNGVTNALAGIATDSERTGSTGDNGGAANTYSATVSNNVNVTTPEVELYIADTSVNDQPLNLDSDLDLAGNNKSEVTAVVGETVRMRMIVRIPESTTANFGLSPNLPVGLQFTGNAKVAFVSDESGMTSTGIGTPSGLTMSGGTLAFARAVTPTADIPAGQITSADGNATWTSGEDPQFNFGTVVNGEADVNNEYIVVEFDAKILNQSGADFVVANNNKAGDTLATTFAVYKDTGFATALVTSNAAEATIREPALAAGTLARTSALNTAGTQITNTVTFRFDPASSANAYDVRIADARIGAGGGDNIGARTGTFTVQTADDAGFSTGLATLTDGAGYVFTSGSDTGQMDITLNAAAGLAPGKYVRVVYTASIDNSAVTLDYSGTGDDTTVSWTSTPGNSATATTGTGETQGERSGNTGQGAGTLNKYSGSVGANAIPDSADKTATAASGGAAVSLGTFTFTDADGGDTLNAVRFDTLPTLGQIWVDSDGNGAINGAESALGAGSVVLAADVANIKYLAPTSGTVDTALKATFSVRDSKGTFDATANNLFIDINPSVDLNGATAGVDNSVTFVEQSGTDTGATAVNIFAASPVSDLDNANLRSLTLTASQIQNGNSEILRFGSTDVPLATNATYTATAGGTTFQIAVTGATGGNAVLAITRNGGGEMPKADLNTLMAGITYRNTLDSPTLTTGGTTERRFDVQVQDSGTADNGAANRLDSNTPRAVVKVEAPTVELTVVSTTISTTGPNSDITIGDGVGVDATVGEIVRMRIVVSLPEVAMNDFRLTPNLPPGLIYLNDGNTRVAFVSNGSGISSADPDGGGARVAVTGAGLTGSAAATPTAALNTANIVVADSNPGTDPTFHLGNLVNADRDADAEYVVIEFNALVANVSANVAGHGAAQLQTVANLFRDANNATAANVSNVANLTLKEPALAATPVRSESRTGAVGSETITYATEFRISNGANATTAYDLRVHDPRVGAASTGDNLGDRSSLLVETSSDGTTWTTRTAGTDYSVASSTAMDISFSAGLAPGTYVRVTYGVPVQDSAANVTPGNTFVTWTSLPGGQGPAAAGDFSQTPGASGAANGERNGANTGVNIYYAESGLNTAPTATDFHKTTGANAAVAIATADLGYADADSDAFSLVRVDTAPSTGTLFVDANNNGIVDTGDTIVAQNGAVVTANRLVSATDIAAGRFKYLAAESGTPDNALGFTFSVRDSRGAFDAAPNTATFDIPPRVDLNGTAAGVDTSVSYVKNEGQASPTLAVAAANPLRDVDNSNLQQVVVTAGNIVNAASERLNFGSTQVPLGANGTFTVTQGATTFQIAVTNGTTAAPTITITRSGGGQMSTTDTSALLAAMTYTNAAATPTQGARTFAFSATDAGTNNTGGANQLTSATATATINVSFVPTPAGALPAAPAPPPPPPPPPPAPAPVAAASGLVASSVGVGANSVLPAPPAAPTFAPLETRSEISRAVASLPDPTQTGQLRLDGQPVNRLVERGAAVVDRLQFEHSNPAELANLQFETRTEGGAALPPWANFNPISREFTAAPTADVPPGTYNFVVIARDSQGNEARSEVTIRVPEPQGTPAAPADAPPPTLTLPQQGASLEAPISAPALTLQVLRATATGQIGDILRLMEALAATDARAA